MAQRALSREDFATAYQVFRRLLRPYRGRVVLLIVFSLLTALADAFVPLLAGRIFDQIILLVNNPGVVLGVVSTIGFIIGAWFLLELVSDLASWQISIRNDDLGTTLHAHYVSDGFARLLLMPVSFHKKHKQGELGQRIDRGGGFIEFFITNVLVNVFPQLLTIFVVFVVTFIIEPHLALVLLGAVLLYVFIMWRAVPGLASLQKKMNRAYNEAYGDAY